MFSRITRRAARDSFTRLTTSPKRSFTATASAASRAISVPPPIAIPTSADFSAGASLMPSPTIATGPDRFGSSRSSAKAFSLSSGISSARYSMPSSMAMRLATRSASPVNITGMMLSFLSSASALFASLRATSRKANAPMTSPSFRTTTAVLPSSSCEASQSFISPSGTLFRRLAAPIWYKAPSMRPSTPAPAMVLACSSTGRSRLRFSAASTTARASG